jgi:hypothetical protein
MIRGIRMEKLIRRLYAIKSLEQRLSAFARERGCPDVLVKQLNTEVEALLWAYKEVRKLYLTGALLLVGDCDFVRSIKDMPEKIYETDGGVTSCIEFAPDRLLVDRTKDFLSSGREGFFLSAEKTPTWLFCSRYYTSEGEEDKRAVLFDCSVPKQWLEEVGRNSAKEMLSPWMVGIFNTMVWNV